MDPGPPSTPEAVLSVLLASLEEVARAVDDPLSLEGALVRFSSAAARLSIFELEFDVPPARVPGWGDIQKAARASLGLAIRPPGELPFNDFSAKVARATLVILAGVHADVKALLGDSPPGGRCGNARATVMMTVHQRRSELHELRGDHAAALKEQRAAISRASLSLDHAEPDLLHARYGHLLAKNGRVAAAHAEFQRVVDLYPRSVGGRLSRRALERDGALVAPTAARILGLYANRTDNFSERSAGVIALGAHRFPESFDILVSRLEEPSPPDPPPAPRRPAPQKRAGRVTPSNEESERARWQSDPLELWGYDRARVIRALGLLGDRRAIPYLRRVAEDPRALYVEHCEQAIELIQSDPAG